MSSPMITRMFGLVCCAETGAVGIVAATASHSTAAHVLANLRMITHLLEPHAVFTEGPVARALGGATRKSNCNRQHSAAARGPLAYCSARDPTASKAKRRFQSPFMLMTVQPLLLASS